MDNYTYNPWFLPTWMEKNHIKKAHLLRVLGLIGKANLDVWLGQSKKQREDAAKGIKVVPPPIQGSTSTHTTAPHSHHLQPLSYRHQEFLRDARHRSCRRKWS